MLLEIDRIQLAVPDMAPVITRWQNILGAEIDSVDSIKYLNASRTKLRLGTGFIEIISPDGSGIVADAIAKRGAHLFSAGASCLDVAHLQQELSTLSDKPVLENDQLFINGDDIGIKGLRLVVSPFEERPAVGDIDFIYEATLLANDSAGETAKFADIFQLDAKEFVSINSPAFGYDGTLTLFRKDLLHRFEVITPIDSAATMGRFFNKIGPCLYMSFAESANILKIEESVVAMGDGITVDRPEGRRMDQSPNQLWLHPATLGGMMLGISRPSAAWQWSGHPERVESL